MSVLLLLIPLSLLLAGAFLAAYIWAVRSGQYEDTCTPALRVMFDDPPVGRPAPPATTGDSKGGSDRRCAPPPADPDGS